MNLAAIIDSHPGDNVALLSRGRATTYGQLRAQVGALRGGLRDLGVAAGDRVAILSANNPTFVQAYLATLGVGAVAVPVNPTSPPVELERQLGAVRPTAAVVGPAGYSTWSKVDRGLVPSLRHVVAAGGQDVEGAVELDRLLAAAPAPLVEREPRDLAVLMFTSGTAGAPKAAMLTHGNLLANLRQVQAHPGRALLRDDVVLAVLPPFHIFGLNVVLGLTLQAGACVVLLERFDPVTALETVVERGVTVVSAAPPVWVAWASMPTEELAPLARLRLASSGAAKLPEDVGRRLRDLGVAIGEGYGLTEASPVVTSSAGTSSPLGSIGTAVPDLELRLVDADGDDVLVGDAGEIWVRGPNVFAGYWENDTATAVALTPDGWLRTGDVAVVDDDGWAYIVDRAKDLIIVSGFNVYPAEVEEVLSEHPGVRDVAVIGVAHPYSGEAVVAFVVADPGVAHEEDALIAFCEQRLARYKCPSKIRFVEEIPRNAGGKLLRRALR